MRVNPLAILLTASVLLNSVQADPHHELESNWDLQRTILQSVVIRCRTVNRKVTSTLSREQVDKLLATDLSADNDALRDVAHTLDPTLKGMAQPWTVGEYIFDVDSVRENLILDGLTRSHVWHRDLQIVKDPHNNQVNLESRARSTLRMPRIEDFVFFPPSRSIGKAKTESKDGKLILFDGRLIVDADTGFVEVFRHGKYPGRFEEVMQYGLTVHGDVAIPSWRFRGEYRGRNLSKFTLRIIDDIEFATATDQDFAVSAEPKTVIVDLRGEKVVPIRVEEPVYDVQSLDLERVKENMRRRKSH